ncbi:hypothetical protein SETIT_9G532600v2 [Setaria italica]|uniref:Transmembrane protein n=1 Tax=Setaria italica TaxID=4555 RepID=A0A368SVL7_SETIT|nr:hypothetical protein SETIT_9G532600v2 [Setaria italica]
MWRRLDCSCRRVVLLPMPLFVRLPSLSVLGHRVSAWWWWWWLSTLLWEILLLCLPRITLTIVILVACIGLLSSGFAAPVALDDAFSEWMLCRSVYALWVDVLPLLLYSCRCFAAVCLDGCFAIMVVLLGWMLCHR